MLIKMTCPQCGAQMTVDDTREHIFCTYCGYKIENITQKIEVSGTVQHIVDHSNEPNLYINFTTIDSSVSMVTRIVSTGQKNTYINGQTLSFHLPKGKQQIVLKIGRKNYDREIVIPEDNSPVRIYASFNGRNQISIDQPAYSAIKTAPSAQSTATVTKPMSVLSVWAFILALTVWFSPIGVVLGFIDKKKGDPEKRHSLTLAAIIIGFIFSIFTVLLIIGLFTTPAADQTSSLASETAVSSPEATTKSSPADTSKDITKQEETVVKEVSPEELAKEAQAADEALYEIYSKLQDYAAKLITYSESLYSLEAKSDYATSIRTEVGRLDEEIRKIKCADISIYQGGVSLYRSHVYEIIRIYMRAYENNDVNELESLEYELSELQKLEEAIPQERSDFLAKYGLS